jgi:hypothetical protein
METDTFRIAVAALIFAVIWIAIGVIQPPKNAPQIKWLFYVLAAVVFVFYLLQYT